MCFPTQPADLYRLPNGAHCNSNGDNHALHNATVLSEALPGCLRTVRHGGIKVPKERLLLASYVVVSRTCRPHGRRQGSRYWGQGGNVGVSAIRHSCVRMRTHALSSNPLARGFLNSLEVNSLFRQSYARVR